MMLTPILIALAAALASALMFASIASGAVLSLALFYLAPLPLMVVALGWGSRAGFIAGAAAVLGLGSMFGPKYMLAYAVMVALPALWLGHLALLARASAALSYATHGAHHRRRLGREVAQVDRLGGGDRD